MSDSDTTNFEGLTDAESSEVKLERLELALKASNEGIWDWTSDADEIYYSRRILEFFECSGSHAPRLFEPPFEHIHPEDRPAFEGAVGRVFEDRGPEILAVDTRVRTGSGEWRWIRIRGTVLRDRNGKAYRIAGSMIDISRRKTAEAQVEEERFLLRQLINHIPVNVYFKDLESRFVMVNQGMASWIGFSDPDDLVGMHDKDIFEEEHWKPAEADERRIIKTGTPITGLIEEEARQKGDTTWVSTSKFPWRGRHGNIKGTFGVSSDVTALEKSLRKATDLAVQLKRKNDAYEEELALAREIQQALTGGGFPDVTDGSRCLKFDSRYIPSSDLAGDFFEVICFRPDCAAVLICDVMGHGVRSALIVAMLRGLLEKQQSQANDPGAFFQGLNDGLAAILERANTTMFATAFYGVIDLPANTFSYACAGHPGPIIETSDGVCQIATERSQKGPGLGLVRGVTFPTFTMPLDGLRRIILFTDGIIEAENAKGEPFDEERFTELIGRSSNDPLPKLLDDILANVLSYCDARDFGDDVCLLGIDISKV